MTTVSLINEKFEQSNYETVIEIASAIPFQDIPLSVLPAVIHSYYEIGDYENCIHYGVQVLKSIIDNNNQGKRDIELTILAIIASYEKKEKAIKQYQYLILYDKIGLNNHKVLNKLKSVEIKLIRKIILILNIICFSFIAVTYMIEPIYRKSMVYFLFVLVFFIHLAIDYFIPNTLQSRYTKIIRFIL